MGSVLEREDEAIRLRDVGVVAGSLTSETRCTFGCCWCELERRPISHDVSPVPQKDSRSCDLVLDDESCLVRCVPEDSCLMRRSLRKATTWTLGCGDRFFSLMVIYTDEYSYL